MVRALYLVDTQCIKTSMFMKRRLIGVQKPFYLASLTSWDLHLLVYENQVNTFFPNTAEEKILYLTPEQEKDKSHFTDKEVCGCFPSLLVHARKHKSMLEHWQHKSIHLGKPNSMLLALGGWGQQEVITFYLLHTSLTPRKEAMTWLWWFIIFRVVKHSHPWKSREDLTN